MSDRLLLVSEAARRLGISTRGVRQAIARGRMIATSAYGVTVIPEGEVERYAADRRNRAGEEVAGG